MPALLLPPRFAEIHTCRREMASFSRVADRGAIRARSALLCTTTRANPDGNRARIARSSASSASAPARASTSNSTRSARSTAAHVRSMPIASTGSAVSRNPAVSTIVSGMPAISTRRSTVSRVVPATGVTIAASSRASALSRLDLPTLGRPTRTTVRPSRSRAPVAARARTSASVSRMASSFATTSPARRNSMSSSGKSSVASVYMRNSISASTNSWICCEKTPVRLRAAARAAVAVEASMRSATLSASTKSSLPFRNARLVNSPGSAMRAPNSMQRARTSRSTAGPPCPCSSRTDSPV